MKICYKCRTPFLSEGEPGFQEVCEKCGSYLHCCCNCRFYDEFARPRCREPNADAVSDPNGMNHCEYFLFKSSRSLVDDPEDPEQRRTRCRPDWRNLRKDGQQPPFQNSEAEERAQRARDNLKRLFGG